MLFWIVFADCVHCLSTNNIVAMSFSLVKWISRKASGLLSENRLSGCHLLPDKAQCFLFQVIVKFQNTWHHIPYMKSNVDPGSLVVITPRLFTLSYHTTFLEAHRNIIAVAICLRSSVKLKSYKNTTLNCKRVTQLPWQRERDQIYCKCYSWK